MEWKTPLIIVRPVSEGAVEIVNEPTTLKDARYWLNYIAEPFDALHLTPTNPKYVGSGNPTYSCHLVLRAKTDYNEKVWNAKVFGSSATTEIKFIPFQEKKSTKKEETKVVELSETEILQLADGNPKNLSLQQIQAILTLRQVNLKVILFDAAKWIDWESALTLMTKDVHVIGLSPDPKWPLSVSLNPASGKGETMNYDKQMKFIVRV